MNPVNHIAVMNRSRLDDGDVALVVEADRSELAKLAAAWSLPVPGLALYPRTHNGRPNEEAAIFLVDSGGDPSAFGAHTLLGISRWGYVDIGLCAQESEPWDRVFGHELWEMVVDPDLDRWAGPMPDGSHYAVEVADPVQRSSRRVEVDLFGRTRMVEIADWVTPAWFDPTATGVPFDDMRLVKRPLDILDGGYQVRQRNGVILTSGAAGVRVTAHGRTFRRMQAAARAPIIAPDGQRDSGGQPRSADDDPLSPRTA